MKNLTDKLCRKPHNKRHKEDFTLVDTDTWYFVTSNTINKMLSVTSLLTSIGGDSKNERP